jgi:hypothetical protein
LLCTEQGDARSQRRRSLSPAGSDGNSDVIQGEMRANKQAKRAHRFPEGVREPSPLTLPRTRPALCIPGLLQGASVSLWDLFNASISRSFGVQRTATGYTLHNETNETNSADVWSQVSVIKDLDFSPQNGEARPDEGIIVREQVTAHPSWCSGGVLSTALRSRGVCCAGASVCGGGHTCSGGGADSVCRRDSANDTATEDSCCVGELCCAIMFLELDLIKRCCSWLQHQQVISGKINGAALARLTPAASCRWARKAHIVANAALKPPKLSAY